MENVFCSQFVVKKPGGYRALQQRHAAMPKLQADEYLVEVNYIGVNYADTIVRKGYYAAAKGAYPIVPGFEYAGRIKQVGATAQKFKVGDQVCGITRFGAYTSAIIATETTIRSVPNGWSLAEAAAFLVPNLTAYHGVHHVAHVQKAETVLIHSAAGGVGAALIQQCAALKCNTIAVVGHASKIAVAQASGAKHVLVRSKNLWAEVDRLAPTGLDVVFDANGLTTPKQGYARMRHGGRLVVYGFAELFARGQRSSWLMIMLRALRVPKFSLLNLPGNNRSICGFNIIHLFNQTELLERTLNQIINLANQDIIQKPVVKEFKFSAVAQAHQWLESGQSVGRIVLKVEPIETIVSQNG